MAAPIQIRAMGCDDTRCDFKTMDLQRRPLGDNDVLIDVKFCGVCHTDLCHAAGHTDFLAKAKYPSVPGHEMAGVVEKVGPKVTKFKVGDQIGVGVTIDSCHDCKYCHKGREHQCTKSVATYQGEDWSGRAAPYPPTRPVPGQPGKTEQSPLLGGYTDKMVVHEYFGIRIPATFPLEYAGPVTCSGITMYDPLKTYGAGKGTRVGIVGLGGLGVIGIKLAKQMGCKVTAMSRAEAKRSLATKAGADEYIATAEREQMKKAAETLDIILDTIPVEHDILQYVKLLRAKESKLIILGLSSNFVGAWIANRLLGDVSRVQYGYIGSVGNCEEVLQLCDQAEPKILPEVVLKPVEELNNIMEMLDKSNDAGVRYVLDMSTLNKDTPGKCTTPAPQIQEQENPLSLGRGVGWFFSIMRAECSLSCCCHCLTGGLFWDQTLARDSKAE